MTSELEASDPSGADVSTSHERASGRSWDATYRDADPAPWDIGRPQAPFVRIASERGFAGPVLDAGCGTGEHALLAASLLADRREFVRPRIRAWIQPPPKWDNRPPGPRHAPPFRRRSGRCPPT